MRLLLGIDIGTSAVKATVFDLEGSALRGVTREYPVEYPRPGWAQQDPRDWWREAALAVRALITAIKADGLSAGDIGAVGVDGQSWSAILIDDSGRVLAPTPIWMDTRAQSECELAEARLDMDSVFRLCGNPLSPGYVTPKLLWYKRHMPDEYNAARRVLGSNAYIVYRLTGRESHDLSQGYGLHCFDMARGVWDYDMAEALGIRPELLPELFPCDGVVGEVTSEAAAQTGLFPGTPVVAGGLDAACGTLGAGVLLPGQTQVQGGQAGGMSICMDAPLMDKRLILGQHVVPGMFLLQGGTVGGGGALKWFARELGGADEAAAKAKGMTVFEELSLRAGEASRRAGGVLFLPYMAGERSPIWDVDARGVFFGLSYATTRGDMARAVMEGVAYSLRHNLDIAAEAGAMVSAMHAMGGAAQSHVWTQIKADVTGHSVLVPEAATATTLGAAMLAGVGAGLYKGYAEAVGRTIRFTRRHEPDEAAIRDYDEGYRAYRALYPALRGIMHREYK